MELSDEEWTRVELFCNLLSVSFFSESQVYH